MRLSHLIYSHGLCQRWKVVHAKLEQRRQTMEESWVVKKVLDYNMGNLLQRLDTQLNESIPLHLPIPEASLKGFG